MSYVSGKKVLVTGATDGIGRAVALELAARGARVLVHGREAEKTEEVVSKIRELGAGERAHGILGDFKSLQDVRRMAEDLKRDHPDLRLLVNNAGIYSNEREITPDGFEATIQVNYLAPFLLTRLLLDSLRANAPSRIVNVTSALHYGARLEPENLFDTKGKFDSDRAYASSKLALVLFTTELADRLKSAGVTVNCVHPGAVETKLLREGSGALGKSVEEGAKPVLHLADAEEVSKVTGAYYSGMRKDDPDVRARDRNLRSRLWIATERVTGIGAAAPEAAAGRGAA